MCIPCRGAGTDERVAVAGARARRSNGMVGLDNGRYGMYSLVTVGGGGWTAEDSGRVLLPVVQVESK